MFEFLVNHYDRILMLFFQHLMLTVVSLSIALLIALPLGIWLSRIKWISVPVLSVLGILYSIPSLAMFAFLIPIVGLGVKSAIIALVAYSQLILVRNVMVGFQSIDPAIIEAGKGMGLGSLPLFWKIEFPLALPVILGGIRIATISTIGIATIAAWINAGGLGVILFEGLYQNHTPKMVWGTIFVSLLAIASNQLLLSLEKRSSLKVRGELASK
ncbi:ABC transporter permease [Lederbergia citrea]|uniref:ABC transporter permease n=1 Tax=Lederbergia citrea TaxID=2833581 RepID=A0A942Z6B0_9BACI|nr:ABC transporter permease [Lederbergia citrea]MBS4178842.1 ABC transporter permease [Lederbergia citrea]MBS4224142.1 ABC transporter permease [Lederbergia citrea]